MLPHDMERWKRQIAIPHFGSEAQHRLLKSKVVIFGAGGVGCPAALYLAAAGVGSLVLVDFDTVALDNLNRQILYGLADIGRSKVEAAAARLLDLDSSLKVDIVDKKVNSQDIKKIIKDASFVIDAFDKINDRLSIDKACIENKVAVAHGFAQEFAGESVIVIPGETACLHCIIDNNYPERDITPILGVTAGIIGTYLASAAIKFITNYGKLQAGYRMLWDLSLDQFVSFPLNRRSDCKICGNLNRGG